MPRLRAEFSQPPFENGALGTGTDEGKGYRVGRTSFGIPVKAAQHVGASGVAEMVVGECIWWGIRVECR